MNVLLQMSMYSMVAMGMTFVIISGGIDLSVGCTVGLTAEVLGLMALAGVSYGLAIPIVLIMGFVWVRSNGIMIHPTKITPFIVTLATHAGVSRYGAARNRWELPVQPATRN